MSARKWVAEWRESASEGAVCHCPQSGCEDFQGNVLLVSKPEGLGCQDTGCYEFEAVGIKGVRRP